MLQRMYTKYSIILYIIINLLILKIFCEDCVCDTLDQENLEETCLNCQNCKYFYQDKTCIACSLDLSNSYYTKTGTGENVMCEKVDNVNDYKLIYGTKELVRDNCPTENSDYTYELGSICYDSTSLPSDKVEISEGTNKYKCINYFYKVIKNGFNYYTCLSSNDKCPTTFKYYDSSTNECLNSCDRTIKKEPNGDTYIFRCSENCISDESNREYEYKVKKDDKTIRYCLTECPDEAKYFYEDTSLLDDGQIAFECLEKCYQDHFSSDNKCVSTCDRVIMDISKKTFSCTSDCTANFPFSYSLVNGESTTNYCLKSCNDTNNEKLFGTNKKKTYLYENSHDSTIERSCRDENEIPEDYYKDEALLKLVQDCKISLSGPFHDSDSCKSSCGTGHCSTSDTFECISTEFENLQSSGYYLDDIEEEEKICYKTCPDYLGRGFQYENENENERKCTSCADGYYRSGDKTCYSSCDVIPDDPNTYYHNFGSNFCFKNGCNNNPLFKYHKNDEKICYQSCFNITDTSYEKDYVCYDSEPSDTDINDYYYYDIQRESSTPFRKYTKNRFDCLQAGFPFLKDDTKECISSCNDNNYKILHIKNDVGKCCENLDTCKNETYKYYNNTDKIITTKCNEFTVVDINGAPLTEDNCLEGCPNGYCEDIKNKLCYQECKNYYKDTSEKKIYTEKCNTFFYKESETINRCVDKCGIVNNENGDIQYTYYLDTKECIDSCPKDETTTAYYYSYKTETNHQQCLEECKSDEYYYESTTNPRICYNECDKYYKNNDNENRLCVEKCENNQFIHPGNICSSLDCPNTAPFFIILNENGESIINNKCVENCKENNYDYYNVDYEGEGFSPNQCMKQCPGYIYNGGCYANCPEGLFIKSENNNTCVPNCDKNFYLNEDSTPRYQCTDECNDDYPFLTSSNECVKKCPKNEMYIGENNRCLTSCEKDENKFYEEKAFDTDTDPDSSYKNYQCLDSCSSANDNKNIYKFGEKECISSCNNYLYVNGNEKICYQTCNLNKLAPFSTENDQGDKVCSNECLKEGEKNFLSDKICISECPSDSLNNTIDDSDGSCISKCNLTSKNKFLQVQSNSDTKLHCKEKCDTFSGSKNRYLRSNYICIEKCEQPNNYVVEDEGFENANECLNKCPDNKPYMRENDKGEYICSDEICGENEYNYLDTKICLPSCGESLYFNVSGAKKYCADSCFFFQKENENLYYLDDDSDTLNKKKCVENCEETSKKFTKLNNHCDTACDTNEFYNDGEFICLSKCPYGTTTTENDGKKCIKCENLDPKQYVDEQGNCVADCETNSAKRYIYHNKDEYNCLDNCNGKFIEDNICKNSCETKLYIYNKMCLEFCPSDRRFFVDNGNGNYINTTCLNDCPKGNPFYTIEIDASSNTLYKCKNNCNSYIPSQDPNKNAKYCLGDACNETYKYYTTDESNKKMCYSLCPTDKPYYVEESNNLIHCYDECPNNYVHLTNEFECIQLSNCKESKKIKYKEKECVDKCSKSDKYFFKNDLTFCVDKCDDIPIDVKGVSTPLKLTYDNICVKSCSDYSEYSKEDTVNNLCICTRLFYYNKTTGYKHCLNPDLTLCEKQEDFPILKVGENECTNYCDGILSLSGKECYKNDYPCEDNEEIKTLINGDKVCDCMYKYYTVEENKRNVKKCLSKGEECPSPYLLLIKETKECVKECPPDNFIYGKTCVLKCPSGTEAKEDSKKCECAGKWYISDNSDLVCVSGDCPSNKYLYVEKTKECVSTCIGTGSEVYFSKTCIENCEGKSDRKIVSSKDDPFLKEISSQYCKCQDGILWYYDGNGYEVCSTSDITSCEQIGYKYKISSTNQCVNSCPDNYYRFNDECLFDCENEHKKDEESKMCICINLWKYIDSKRSKKECIKETKCPTGYLLIDSTNECYNGDKCPNEYAQFEKTCYEKNNCPLNTKYDEISQKCACANKWYITESGEEKCLSENSDCPGDYPYLNIATKECSKGANADESDKILYEFNYVFYSNCPENTIKDETNPRKCICDPLLGYWHEDQEKDGKIILKCGLKECPSIRPYNIYQEKECLPICPEEYRYLYQGICYNKCPDLTEASGNSNECQLKTVDNEINLQTLEKTVTENIVDLYKKSSNLELKNNSTSVGQKIVTQDATVEFYGVNKKNKGKTNQNIQSDLSYIDISECIDKIYKSNKMQEKDDIVILKFDVNKIPNKYLINPVEYKLINSRTGQELDASICEHNSIRISYPVHDLINKYDKITKNIRKLNYMKIDLISNNKNSLREKLDKGKEIYDEYPDVDIFDINSKIYSDICIAVEVDGKDLVLEDRIDYFYPQLSLCENNCTYNRTDFANERIYCDCSYKTEFDFEREYSSSFELNSNQVKNDQSGNSNIAILKCISNLKNSKSISKNYGFIYSLIIIILEVILFCVIAFWGIKTLLNRLKAKMGKDSEKDDNIEEKNIVNTNDNKNTYENIKTSERNLNHPPKKKKDFDIEFIPQEYLFLFFNVGEKDSIKKVLRDNVPFKTKINTRILLEQKKGVNYNNIKPTGPFPQGQNILVIVDNMEENINDYLGLEDSFSEEENKKKKKQKKNKDKQVDNDDFVNVKSNEAGGSKISKGERGNLKINEKGQKTKVYLKKIEDFTISDYDPSDENYSVYDVDEEEGEPHEKGIIETLKSNQRLMRRNYEIAIKNKNVNFIEVLLTEILDKIYITKILFFTRKFDIFSLQLSIYLLCHIILLVFTTLFFDIKTIKNIWIKENYPGLGYYLGYGFLACLIVWIIYTIFLCLLTNNDKIKEILKLIHYNKKFGMNQEKNINKKYQNLEWKIKFKFGIYTLIESILLIFSFLYLTVFCTVYTGTQSKTFKEYGIALVEILIIKILYAIALAIMRYISLTKQKKTLYEVVLFMNTYLV